MFTGTSPPPRKRIKETHQENNDLMDGHQMQRTYDLTKIGNFDEESWIKIFQLLPIWELANLATVCKKFETLAQYVFKIKNSGESKYFCELNEAGWKLVACRFRNSMPGMYFKGRKTCSNSEGALHFIEEFLSESLRSVMFDMHPTQFREFTFSKTFVNLKELSLRNVDSIGERNVLVTLNKWCPNLKSLFVINSSIDGPDFYFQSLPLLESLKLNNVSLNVPTEQITDFFSANNQLKELTIEDVNTNLIDNNISWLKVVNELLTNLETMTWATDTLDFPELQNQYANLKSLSFLMAVNVGGNGRFNGTYKNQLLKIVKHLPKIESLRIINCRENLMTNDDLIELIVESSSTLLQLHITSYEPAVALKFGYDLHHQIFGTASRSKLCICFDFGDAFLNFRMLITGKESVLKAIKITEDGIWENDRLIVLASTNR